MKIRTLKLRKPVLALSIFLGFMMILSTTAFSVASQPDSKLDGSEVPADQPASPDKPKKDPGLDDSKIPVDQTSSLTNHEDPEEPEDRVIEAPEAPLPQTVSYIGAATQSIPIVVPPGRNGLQPAISLQYSSYNGNGWLGVGWDLNMGSISRSTRYGLHYSANDYVVDGSDLVPLGNNYFGAKIEGAFTKYQFLSGGNYWIATAKDGTKYYYGSRTSDNSNSRMTNSHGTFSWHLDKVEDTNGNYMEIDYTIDQNQIYLYRIRYTYHTGLPGYAYRVEFDLEDRNDDPNGWHDDINSYKTHSLVTTAKRLRTITVKKADDTPAYKYELIYNNSGPNGRSRLAQIKQEDPSNPNISLPPYIFTYLDGGDGTFGDVSDPLSLEGGTGEGKSILIFGDINGDGRQDFIKAYAPSDFGPVVVTVYPYLANSYGGFTAQTSKTLEQCFYDDVSVTLGDVDGNGWADILSNGLSGQAHVYLSNGNGTFLNKCTTTGLSSDGSVSLAEVNGDGKADLVRSDGTFAHTFISNGNGYFGIENTFEIPMILPSDTIGRDIRTNLTDINGDGKADLYVYKFYEVVVGEGQLFPATTIGIFLGNVYGTFSSTPFFMCTEEYRVHSDTIVDINGDGLSDLAYVDPDKNLHVYLSNGTGMTQASPNLILNTVASRFADIDDDGMADMFNFDSSGNNYFYKSNGDGTFASPSLAGGVAGGPSSVLFFADINGDGRSDMMKHEYSINALSYSLANGEDAADCIESISNPLGGITNITYRNSSGLPNNKIPYIVHPVKRIDTFDGIDIGTPALTSSYEYSDGYYNYDERDFRGFRTVEKTNPDNSYEKTEYHQDEFKKNRPVSTEFRDSENGPLLTRTTYDWKTDPVNPDPDDWAFVYLDSKKTEYENNAAYYTEESYEYNNTNGFPENIYKSGTDANGSPIEQVIQHKVYDEFPSGSWTWRLTEETVAGDTTGPARKTTYIYDSNGNMTDKIFWKTPSSSYPAIKYSHDPYGNVTSEWTVGFNNATTIEYETDTYTYPWRITNCLNQVTTKTWDYRFGKEDLVTDPNGNKTDYAYDAFGRVINIANKDASNNFVGYSATDYTHYDQTAFPRYITTRTLESGDVSTGAYIEKEEHLDGLNRSIKTVTDGKNEDGSSEEIVTKTRYDEMGRKEKVEGPYFSSEEGTGNYYSETISYDKLGRVTKVESPDGGPDPITTSYNYPSFFTTEITDPDGKKKTEKKDHLGRIVEVIEHAGDDVENPVPQTTRYGYNAAGDMTGVTNALNIATNIAYDLRGLKTSMDDPDMGDWIYAYDGNGNLWTQTDAKGDIITFGYDGLNRILSKTYTINNSQETAATRNVAYTYDLAINGIGRPYSVENTDVTTVYDEYDAMGRVLSVSKTIAGDQERTIDTAYDKSGKVETIAYPDGSVVTNSYYPGTGLLHEVTGTMSGNTKSYAKCTGYEPTGKIRRIYHDYNGTDSVYNYDPLTTRLMDIQTSGGATESSSGSVFVQDRTYEYTKAGDIEQITDYRNGASYTYAYDNLHRLLSEASTGNVPIPSPEVLIYTYDNNDKPNAVRNINYNGTDYGFTYDANGNMRSGYDFTDPDDIVPRVITWNADNMPVSVTRDGTSTTLTYDGDGARAKKAAGGTTTYYISNDYEIKNGAATKYIFAGNLRVATIDNTDTYIFHKDHLGSSTAMTKYNDVSLEFEIEETTEYLPFGGMRGHTGVEVSDYKFTDQERDSSSNSIKPSNWH